MLKGAIVLYCRACGRTIVVQDYRVEGRVSSEFRDAEGRCFECNRVKRQVRDRPVEKQGRLF